MTAALVYIPENIFSLMLRPEPSHPGFFTSTKADQGYKPLLLNLTIRMAENEANDGQSSKLKVQNVLALSVHNLYVYIPLLRYLEHLQSKGI